MRYVDPLENEMAVLSRDVTLGKWDAVKSYLLKLPEEEAKAGYGHLLQSLTSNRPEPGVQPQMMQFMERNKFSSEDVLGLAGAAPHGLDKEAINSLGAILGQALGSGTVVEYFVTRLKTNLSDNPKQPALSKRQAAQVLLGAGQGVAAGEFLPGLEQAIQDKDHEALNLLSRHFLAMHQKDPKAVHLENAWKATRSTLSTGNVKPEDQEKAVKQAVELAPRIRENLGQAWLDESFTLEPQRGMDILATIGAGIAKGFTTSPREPDLRLKSMQLQKTAVAALLKAAPQRAADWRKTLTLLAGNWLREAEFSHQHDRSAGLGPGLRRDPYGNFFYMDEDEPMPQYMMMQQRENMPQPIRVGPLLETRPEEAWLDLVDSGVQPKINMVFAQLYLKVNEEGLAFPFIEKLAATHPDKSRQLAKEFLQVWTRNHDPNASRGRMNRYMYMYGFETRAESIPLTRSKQERNLLELARWVERLRGLDIGEIDEKTLTKAFTACHSSAEVYRLDALEKVFGSVGALKPLTLAGMGQQMRENLGGLWRDPAVQKDKKTNRKSKDIQAEVVRGYAVAQAVLDKGLEKNPDHWALYLASAALRHDENNYQQELAKTSQFSAQREKAMASFQKAAQLYAEQVKDLSQDEETIQAFEQWLYASLGACDLKNINEDKLPDTRQPALIKKAIMSLPKEAAERHLSTFANSLFTRLSAVNPAVKYRYLKAGLEIVGDHKMALEAHKVFDYYKDLITEIKLDTAIDGSDVVGNQQPFGVFVNLRHTREIERESGGFGRYLQNQNSSSFYSYNYGRPTADYRDKFQAAATEALKEHFEVLSITFQTDKVNSRALAEYGWRYTPYAYLLLKPRGAQIDKVPSVRLDLDFLETSGYVVLPIESATLPIDAGAAKAPTRPLHKLQISQILDERQADKGKLVLEIKAAALGLVPELDKILTLDQAQFVIEKSIDQGVSVVRFDPDSEQNAVVSERSWIITFKAKTDLSEPATVFRFGVAKVDEAELTYQRVYRRGPRQCRTGVVSGTDLWQARLCLDLLAGRGRLGFCPGPCRRHPEVTQAGPEGKS